MPEMIKKGQKPPYIALTETEGEEVQAFLVVDRSIVCEAPLSVTHNPR